MVEKAIRDVARQRSDAGFVRRGLSAIARAKTANNGIPADRVIAKLEAKLTAARKARRA